LFIQFGEKMSAKEAITFCVTYAAKSDNPQHRILREKAQKLKETMEER